jgi:hypothetical protein
LTTWQKLSIFAAFSIFATLTYINKSRVKINLKPEDEMDFIPIIPLNETDGDGADVIDIPEELSLLPLRNTVLFPGVVLPITVGRDKSIKAVSDAYKGNKLIGVIAQKDSSVEDPSFFRPGDHRYRSKDCEANQNARRWNNHNNTRKEPFCCAISQYGRSLFQSKN